ncbi:hypothetical protein Dimus_039457 [Dionaea muscipula]
MHGTWVPAFVFFSEPFSQLLKPFILRFSAKSPSKSKFFVMARKALILAPNADDRGQLIELVRKHGFDITAMDDKESALDELRFGQYWDLVLLEIDEIPGFVLNLVKMRIASSIIGISRKDSREADDKNSKLNDYRDFGASLILTQPLSDEDFEKVLDKEGRLDMDISEPYVPPRGIPKSDGAHANLQSSTFSHHPVEPLSEGDIKKVLDMEGLLNTGIPKPCEPCGDQRDKMVKGVLVLTEGNTDEQLLAILRKHNLDIRILRDYEEALGEFWEGKHYDAIFLDMENGPEVAKSLKNMAIQTMIIGIVSDENYLDMVGDEFLTAGVEHIFAKPLSEDGIETTLALAGLIPEPQPGYEDMLLGLESLKPVRY